MVRLGGGRKDFPWVMEALMAGCALGRFFSARVVGRMEPGGGSEGGADGAEQLWILVNEIVRGANHVNALQ